MIEIKKNELDKLKIIGKGCCSTIYRISEGEILKMYDKQTRNDLRLVKKEFEISRVCSELGILTDRAIDLYECEGVYGASYEYVSGNTMLDAINCGENISEMIQELALIGHKIHSISADATRFPDATSVFDDILRFIKGWVSAAEYEHIKELIAVIPRCPRLVHGDFHPGNVIVSNDRFVLIDIGGAGFGHPVFDLISMYRLMRKSSDAGDKAGIYTKIYDNYLECYFDKSKLLKVGNALTEILEILYYISILPDVTAFFPDRDACTPEIIEYVDIMIGKIMGIGVEEFKELFRKTDELFFCEACSSST